MRSREEFGKYLLLKKLSEDPLGETFRAARGGGQDLEQVVLLRVFNGRRLDGARLWKRIADRAAVQKALKNPNIGNGVDLGAERDVPYVAYDYISGRNLENLLIQASNANSPIPLDHALLIVERMALALAAAAETRVGDGRVVHGFAVPHLVMVSNEGETRVLGFEAAPGLAEQARNFEGQIARYLAPEVVAGQPVDRSDDVFTLGAVLYELIACRPLPAAGAEGGYAAAVDSAQVAHDGTPLPAAVAGLLKRSLAPRGQRLADSADWHKALSQTMANGGYTATTFNLAFFMHNLFRHEIERENQEIEQERTMSFEAPAVAPPPAPGAALETTGTGVTPPPATPAKRSGKGGLFAALAAVLLLAVAGAGWYFLYGPGAGEPEPVELAAPEPESEPEPPPEPPGPTPEEIQAQLAEMIDSRSDEMETKLRDQYDERIRTLQSQLTDAQEESARIAAQREQQRLAEEREAEEARLKAIEDERIAAEQAAERAKAEEAARIAAEEQAALQAAAEAEPPPPPKTKEGDLVSMGAGVSPPQLFTEPETRYPAMAKKLGREANVEVRVLVDERGNVREAQLMSSKKAGFGFDEAALDAARSAKYRPATKDGVKVKMYVNLTIRFNL